MLMLQQNIKMKDRGYINEETNCIDAGVGLGSTCTSVTFVPCKGKDSYSRKGKD
jgi:hypothetical protein